MGVRIKVQSLWPESGESTYAYEFAQTRIVIGRSRSADVQLPHSAVSAIHARILAEGSGYALVDESSTNGTRVNEAPLVPGRPKPLRPNDVVDLGGYRLTVEVGVPVAQTTSARVSTDLAKQILADRLGQAPLDSLDATLTELERGPDQKVELLPIAEPTPSEPPPARASRPSRPRSSRPSQPSTTDRHAPVGRSELAVYALATVVVATSLVAMLLLMRA